MMQLMVNLVIESDQLYSKTNLFGGDILGEGGGDSKLGRGGGED